MAQHLDVPYRRVNGAPVVNEQGSLADIAACVYAVAVTEIGARDELPDFGILDPTFSQQPVQAQPLLQQIERWEDRATLLASVSPDLYDATLVRAEVDVQA